MSEKLPAVPRGTGPRGRRLWRSVLTEWEFDRHELDLLIELVRTADTLDRLQAVVDSEGELIEDRFGEKKVHPAAVEARQLRITFARLRAALRLPEDSASVGANSGRLQRRTGVRNTYKLRTVK